jgi:hypothetical protein
MAKGHKHDDGLAVPSIACVSKEKSKLVRPHYFAHFPPSPVGNVLVAL